jgi:hypothetical protein
MTLASSEQRAEAELAILQDEMRRVELEPQVLDRKIRCALESEREALTAIGSTKAELRGALAAQTEQREAIEAALEIERQAHTAARAERESVEARAAREAYEAAAAADRLHSALSAERNARETAEAALATERRCYDVIARLLLLSQARLRGFEASFGTLSKSPLAHPAGSGLLLTLNPNHIASHVAPERDKLVAKLEVELGLAQPGAMCRHDEACTAPTAAEGAPAAAGFPCAAADLLPPRTSQTAQARSHSHPWQQRAYPPAQQSQPAPTPTSARFPQPSSVLAHAAPVLPAPNNATLEEAAHIGAPPHMADPTATRLGAVRPFLPKLDGAAHFNKKAWADEYIVDAVQCVPPMRADSLPARSATAQSQRSTTGARAMIATAQSQRSTSTARRPLPSRPATRPPGFPPSPKSRMLEHQARTVKTNGVPTMQVSTARVYTSATQLAAASVSSRLFA